MLNASFIKRFSSALAVAAFALIVAAPARSQVIDVSLNVLYDDESDINSGGIWQLVAKSTNVGGFFGIAGFNVHLTNVLSSAGDQNYQVRAPRGKVNGSDDAGFTVDLFNGPGDSKTFSALQIALATEPGQEGAFYGVGYTQNGTPGNIGPTYSTLSNVQGSPWATGDVLGQATWNNAVVFAQGSFLDNTTPGFTGTNSGRVFSTLGTVNTFGDTVFATINTLVRTNFTGTPLPDYNGNGVVDTADYILWRKGSLLADGNNNGMIDPGDYDLWRQHYGEVVSPGAGSGGGSGGTVPEPAAGFLVFLAVISQLCGRPRRSAKPLKEPCNRYRVE